MATPRRAAAIITCLSIIQVSSTLPVYAVNKLGVKFSVQQNKTLFGLIFTENRHQVEKISFAINNFTMPSIAFVIIVVSTVALVIKLRTAAEWRKRSTCQAQEDRVSRRNQKVAKMVVMISTVFIICFIPVCVIMLAAVFEPELSFGGKYLKISILFCSLGFVLESVNSSMNIFIYYHMSSRYRAIFREMFSMLTTKKKK